MTTLHESDVEDTVLEWLGELGWQIAHGLDIMASRRALLLPRLVSGEVRD